MQRLRQRRRNSPQPVFVSRIWIVVLSARPITKGSNPNFDVIVRNTAFRNRPADLRWDGTGIGVQFRGNHCGTSNPPGLCH